MGYCPVGFCPSGLLSQWAFVRSSLLPLWESVIVLCVVVRYFMSFLVLQSSWWGRESWLLFLICLPGVSWWLSGSSSGCHGVVCGLWLWYFLIILTYYFSSADPEMCVKRGSRPNWKSTKIQGFLALLVRIPLKSHSYQSRIQCWDTISPLAKRHLNGVSLAGRWWPSNSGVWIILPLIKLNKTCQC